MSEFNLAYRKKNSTVSQLLLIKFPIGQKLYSCFLQAIEIFPLRPSRASVQQKYWNFSLFPSFSFVSRSKDFFRFTVRTWNKTLCDHQSNIKSTDRNFFVWKARKGLVIWLTRPELFRNKKSTLVHFVFTCWKEKPLCLLTIAFLTKL